MALRTPTVTLGQNFRAGLGEIIGLVSTGIDQLVDIEVKKIALMPQAAQDEIYSRFHAVFNKGVRSANEGAALIYENLEAGVLCDIILEVGSDIGVANDVLSDGNKLEEALRDGPDGFSATSKALIEKEVGQKLNPAKDKSRS